MFGTPMDLDLHCSACNDIEKVLAHGSIVDDVAALALGNLFDARRKVLLAVVDHIVATVPVRELDLLGRADRADDSRAKVLGPLRQDAANATGGGLFVCPDSTLKARRSRNCAVRPSASE